MWSDDRDWSKILFSTIFIPGHDLQVKVTVLDILFLSFQDLIISKPFDQFKLDLV